MDSQQQLPEKSSDNQQSQKKSRNWKQGRRPRNKKRSKLPAVICSLCEKPIDSVSQAIGGPQPDQFSHFDCVLRKISEEETLAPGQKVSYIGHGEFAVIEYKKKNYSGGFEIIRRISYEEEKVRSEVKKMVASRKRTARV